MTLSLSLYWDMESTAASGKFDLAQKAPYALKMDRMLRLAEIAQQNVEQSTP
ncbi:uncharacterized protein TrAFT101_001603 [Trichoderma asperellum]|uniref:uncharacterized protein n=1 Tax=Trichoderma asperellum TaxID=101201 RepID=UPI00331B64D7|nr:hypothetical protein TrAFT101_001603 [Trichoderma asperellum]